VSRFFDRITRPEQLLTALPAAMRTLVDPVETGAVVLSLPQDVQSHAYDFPADFFAQRDWVIRRPAPDPDEIDAVAALLAGAKKPIIIAGGGVIYSDATDELETLAAAIGAPVAETFGGKGAVQTAAWWQIGGIGLEGTPATNTLANEADVVLTVGSRLTDFATGSHSIFANPDVRFASINVNVHDADRLGAVGVIGDAKRSLAALCRAITERDVHPEPSWRSRVEELADAWAIERCPEPRPGVRQVVGRTRLRCRHHD
jgi:3D-(3,5/4)-trihydroxycyclohexane-1,2-dione acylhydrolase (decyclizing)